MGTQAIVSVFHTLIEAIVVETLNRYLFHDDPIVFDFDSSFATNFAINVATAGFGKSALAVRSLLEATVTTAIDYYRGARGSDLWWTFTINAAAAFGGQKLFDAIGGRIGKKAKINTAKEGVGGNGVGGVVEDLGYTFGGKYNPAGLKDNCVACVTAVLYEKFFNKFRTASYFTDILPISRGGSNIPDIFAVEEYLHKFGLKGVFGKLPKNFDDVVPTNAKGGHYIIATTDHVIYGRVKPNGTKIYYDPQIDQEVPWNEVLQLLGADENFNPARIMEIVER